MCKSGQCNSQGLCNKSVFKSKYVYAYHKRCILVVQTSYNLNSTCVLHTTCTCSVKSHTQSCHMHVNACSLHENMEICCLYTCIFSRGRTGVTAQTLSTQYGYHATQTGITNIIYRIQDNFQWAKLLLQILLMKPQKFCH